VNVPEQQDFGVEFDGQIRPVNWLTLGGSLNYTDAEFTSQTVVAFGLPQNFATVPDTPKWSGTFFGECAIPVADRFTATLRGETYSQTGTFYSSEERLQQGVLRGRHRHRPVARLQYGAARCAADLHCATDLQILASSIRWQGNRRHD
jgi:outer membrane receptor protein involved in Fe transport